MESFINQQLFAVLKNMCTIYKGDHEDKIKQLCDEEKYVSAYYTMTKASSDVAVTSKEHLFFSTRSRMGVIPKWRTELPKDVPGTLRTVAWQQDFKHLIPWWNDNFDERSNVSFPNTVITVLTDPDNAGTTKRKFGYSYKFYEMGTHLHERYDGVLNRACLKMFKDEPWFSTVELVNPGRLIHPVIPFNAVTPDGIAVDNITSYLEMLEKDFKNEQISQSLHDEGAIRYVVELKTITGRPGDSDNHRVVTSDDVQDLYRTYRNDDSNDKSLAKAAALKLLTEKLISAKYIPAPNSKRKKDEFFLRATRLYPASKFNSLVQQRKEASAVNFPSVIPLPTLVNGKPVVDKYLNHQIPIADLLQPGKAFITVYDLDETSHNGELFRLDFEHTPFVLPLGAEDMNQVLGQHINARRHNSDVKSIFAVGIGNKRETARDVVKLGLLFGFEVGITPLCAKSYTTVLAREIAYVLQQSPNSFNFGQSLLKLVSNDIDKICNRFANPPTSEPDNTYASTLFSDESDSDLEEEENSKDDKENRQI